jgi:hypothetical protein
MDVFVVPTLSCRFLYGLVILNHGRRQILWLGVTAHPTAEWVARQLTEACGWDGTPEYDEASCRSPARPDTAAPAMIPDLHTAASCHTPSRRSNRMNSARGERFVDLTACVSNIHLKGRPRPENVFFRVISTDTVKSTVQDACEDLKAVIRRKGGDTDRSVWHGMFRFLLRR